MISPKIPMTCPRCGGRSIEHEAKFRMGAVISCHSCGSEISFDKEPIAPAIKKALADA